jgi:hypothetical protein
MLPAFLISIGLHIVARGADIRDGVNKRRKEWGNSILYLELFMPIP